MITDGLSCKGSYHDINQDSFICKPVSNGYIMALSDGMAVRDFHNLDQGLFVKFWSKSLKMKRCL